MKKGWVGRGTETGKTKTGKISVPLPPSSLQATLELTKQRKSIAGKIFPPTVQQPLAMKPQDEDQEHPLVFLKAPQVKYLDSVLHIKTWRLTEGI